MVVWNSVLPLRGEDELVVSVLDVGQGDAILVAFPGGKRMLVDGGPSGIRLARELGDVMPHWQRDIDTVVLTRKSGGAAVGIVASETAETISLRDTEGKIVEVKKFDIAKREAAPSAMPEIYGAILSKSELRDVVEYIGTIGVSQVGRGGNRGGRGPATPAVGGRTGGRGRAADTGLRALRGLTPPETPTTSDVTPPAAK